MNDFLIIAYPAASARKRPGFQYKSDHTAPISRPVAAARRHMQSTGWSYRTAAPVLGCSYQHLAFVLTGRRDSKSLLARIAALPPRDRKHIPAA